MDRKIIALIVVMLLVIGGTVGAILLKNNNSKDNTNIGTENPSIANSSKDVVNNEQATNNNENIKVQTNTNTIATGNQSVVDSNKDIVNNGQVANNNENSEIQINTDNTEINTKKALVLYFSATGTTGGVAKKIQEVLDSDIIEIQPETVYTSADLNYNNDDCRANKEQNDKNARPKIANKIDVSNYDTIYLGYPIWWGTAPKIIFTLLDNYDFSGKNVIPFCTSGGSGIAQSIRDLKDYNKNVNWIDGKKFNSSVSNTDIEKWIKDL